MILERTLAIIGTAGRQGDAENLTKHHWFKMIGAALKVIQLENITALISGGAAWADHVAVHLHLTRNYPVQIIIPRNDEDINTSLRYHEVFSRVLGGRTWAEVGKCEPRSHGRFKDRNTLVAAGCDVYLAMTFGKGREVKDGGTLDTVTKMDGHGVPGYHLDLNTFKLFKR
jgi:hypothetical protein